MAFVKATKQQSRLRLALYGPSGSGKTYTALTIAKELGAPVAVIDTERGSASKYAGDVADFDVLELTSFEPENYVRAMREAAAAKYPTLVIDSLSHAWMGKGGLLDQADQKGGRFDAWKVLTPKQHALIDAILGYPGDVIVTMRTKTEYVVETNSNGKAAPRKVGLAPIQKDGVEYEFDVAGSMSVDNVLTIEKTRCPALQGRSIRHPGADVAKELRAWLSDGAPRPVVSDTAPAEAPLAAKSEPRRTNDTFIDTIHDAIRNAKTQAELDGVGVTIKRAGDTGNISGQQRDVLRRIYGQRQAELAKGAA